jgi:hypothetical protein
MGDEEHNPLAQWEDLEVKKQAEIAAKQVVSHLLLCIRILMLGLTEKNICKTSPICASKICFFIIQASNTRFRMPTTTSGKPIVCSLRE